MDFTRIRHAVLPSAPYIPDYRHISPPLRPVWRGRQHALALIVLTPFLIWITTGCITQSTHPLFMVKIPVAIYSVSLLAVLSISTFYHLAARTPRSQAVMQRLDRATIYLLITGTFTPVLMIVVYPKYPTGTLILLTFLWFLTIIGVFLRSLNKLPKLAFALYLTLGWTGLIIAPALWSHSHIVFALILLGGLAYTTGSIMFAIQRPNPRPTHYGYHEVFHSFTLAGFTLHLSAITLLIIPLAA